MAAPVDPLAWINENPLLLAVGGPIAVSLLGLLFRRGRRVWGATLRGVGRLARWVVSLRVVPRHRVMPSERQLRKLDVAPVRWVLAVNADGSEGVLANSASGTAKRVRVDDGHGTQVLDDAIWPEIPGRMEGKFSCLIEHYSAVAGTATFRLRWTDSRGIEHRQTISPRYPQTADF